MQLDGHRMLGWRCRQPVGTVFCSPIRWLARRASCLPSSLRSRPALQGLAVLRGNKRRALQSAGAGHAGACAGQHQVDAAGGLAGRGRLPSPASGGRRAHFEQWWRCALRGGQLCLLPGLGAQLRKRALRPAPHMLMPGCPGIPCRDLDGNAALCGAVPELLLTAVCGSGTTACNGNQIACASAGGTAPSPVPEP